MFRLVSALAAALLLASCVSGEQTRVENPTPLGQPSITLPATTAPAWTTAAVTSPTASPGASASPSPSATGTASPSPATSAPPTTAPPTRGITPTPPSTPTGTTATPTPTVPPTCGAASVADPPAAPATTLGVYGKVVDACTGRPLADVCVFIGVPGAFCWARTDVYGNYAIDMASYQMSPGQFEFYFRLAGYTSDHSPQQYVSGVVRVDFPMHR